jgi:multiple sugar transport system permease protein
VPVVFIGPVLILQGIFMFGPLGNTFLLAFTNVSTVGGGYFTGLDNFVALVTDGAFWNAAGHTFLYVLITAPVIVVLSTGLAILLNTKIRGSGIVRPLLFSPMVLPLAIVAVVFQDLLKSDGLVNQILEGLHLVTGPVPFLTNSWMALFTTMFVSVWKSTALYTLILLAALQNVSKELDEAAELDGATWTRRTWSVTLPQIRGTIGLIMTLAAIGALRVFTEPFVMTGGGPGDATTTIVLYMFQVGITPGTQAGYASAISLVLFAFVLIGLGVPWLVVRRRRNR